MKRVNIFHLIASICWFFFFLIKFLGLFIELPPILDACSIPFILTAVIMHIIILCKVRKNNKKDAKKKPRDFLGFSSFFAVFRHFACKVRLFLKFRF